MKLLPTVLIASLVLASTVACDGDELPEIEKPGDGYSEGDYVDDYFRVTCDKTFDCYDADTLALFGYGDSADECYDFFMDAYNQSEGSSTCSFDAVSAKGCIESLRALDCSDYMAGSFPSECSAVCGDGGPSTVSSYLR